MAKPENKQSIEEPQAGKERQSGKEIFSGYKGGEEMPLAGYAALLGIYNAALLASLLAAARNSEDGLPERINVSDLLLFGGLIN